MWGDPISAPASADRALMEDKRLELEQAITDLTAKADHLLGQENVPPEIST